MPALSDRARGALRLRGGSRPARLRLVGLLFLVALGALVLVGVLKPSPFSSPETVTAVFDESASLGKILRTVRVEGVNVGTIGEVRRVGDDAEIDLELNEEVGTLREDARAEIRPHIFFEGTVFVELYPGSDDAPPLDGEVIPKQRTDVFVPFDVALRALDQQTRGSLKRLTGEVAPGLSGEAIGGVQQTLRAAPKLLGDLGPAARAARGPSGEELTGAIEGMSQTLGALAGEQERLAPLVADTRRTLAAVTVDDRAPLDETLARLPPTLVELDRGSRAFAAILDRFDPLAADLEPALVELTPTLRQARPLLAQARPVLRRATPLLRELRGAVDLTAKAAPETRALLRALDPSVDLLTDSTLPFLHEETGLGVPNYIQLGSFLAGFAGVMRPYETAAQNQFGTGHLGRIETTALTGTQVPSVPCSSIEGLAPELVETLVELGVCSR